jgi:WD40 repeat protein
MSYLATASSDSTVKLWNIRGLLAQSEKRADPGDSLPSSPETSTARPRPIEPTKELRGHQRWVWDCVFSADSAYLVSASSDHTARLWDISAGESIREYTGHTKAVCCVALSDKETK